MRVYAQDRMKLEQFLKNFYNHYPDERYTVFHFVRYLKRRLKKNKDAWIGVTGSTGSGKSYLAIMCQILFGKKYSLTDNITYIPKGDEILNKFRKLKMNTLLIDEAAEQMRSVNWQDKRQQQVNVAAMTDRFKNNIVFLNLPNFNEFTKSMRIGSIQFRMVIPYRTDLYARVIIQRKSRNWRSEDPWCDKFANKIYDNLEKKRREVDNETILRIEKSMPNTIMTFIVPNLELILPEITNKYIELKIQSREVKQQTEQNKTPRHNFYKDKYEKLMQKATKIIYNNELDLGKGIKITKQEMAQSLGVGTDAFNKYLKMQPTPTKNHRKQTKQET